MKNLKVFRTVLAVAAISAAVALPGRGAPGESPAKVDDKAASAPDWELKDISEKAVHSADFKGKVVILDFWATWCPPCRAEIPGLIALQKQYEKQGLVVIGVSVDEGGAGVVSEFVEKQGINYPVMLADDKVQQAFGGIEAIPTTFVIDREGHIVKKHLGFTEKKEFENEIKPLLNP